MKKTKKYFTRKTNNYFTPEFTKIKEKEITLIPIPKLKKTLQNKFNIEKEIKFWKKELKKIKKTDKDYKKAKWFCESMIKYLIKLKKEVI